VPSLSQVDSTFSRCACMPMAQTKPADPLRPRRRHCWLASREHPCGKPLGQPELRRPSHLRIGSDNSCCRICACMRDRSSRRGSRTIAPYIDPVHPTIRGPVSRRMSRKNYTCRFEFRHFKLRRLEQSLV
jgi:hypothetical protein